MKKDILIEMLDKQFKLNAGIAGEDWILGMTESGKQINWPRTIYMETIELMDSYPWKHWKGIDQKVDMANVHIETVDIWHFIMSLVIENMFDLAYKEIESKELDVNSPEKVMTPSEMWNAGLRESTANHILNIFQAEDDNNFAKESVAKMHPNADNINKELRAFEELTVLSVMLSRLRSNKTNAFFPEEYDALVFNVIALFRHITTEIVSLDIVKLYNGKSVLNQFRQDHGYKEGTYIKEWNYEGKKVEDNVAMAALIESEDLYTALEEVYSEQLA